MEGFLKLSTAVDVTVLMIDSADHVTGKTGLSAGLTIYATKAAGTPAVITPTVTELDATNVKGVYKLAFTTTHSNTLGEFQLHVTAAGADPADFKWQVATYLPGEAATLQATQAVNATQLAGQTITAAAGVTFPTSVASPTNITAGTITTVTTVTGLTASDVGAIKTKTDFLPSATAGAAGGVFIAGGNAATSITTALTANIIGDVTGNMVGSVSSVTGSVNSVVTRVTANTDQLAGQTVTAAAGVTFPTSVASPTNITAGTITTATNVTNVSAGGIAAASFAAGAINAAAIATDAIDADALAADAVTEIQSGLSTLTAAGVRTAVGLASANLDTQLDALPTANENADQVWDEVLSGHLTATTTGAALNAAGAAGDPWITALPGAYGAGTAGFIVGTNVDALISSRTKPADTQAAVTTVTNLTNAPTAGDLTATMKTSVTTAATAATPTAAAVTGAVGSVTGAVGSVTGNVGGNVVGNVNGNVAGSVASVTGNIGGNVAGSVASVTVVSDKTGYRLSSTGVDDILDDAVDGATTLRESIRLANSALGGKASGLATTSAVYRDLADTKDRVTATVDADGNRTTVVRDLT